ncbi:rhodanese-like domain-containing protein [Nonomuraea basaltis]|uniref:rhodanese-like domain-containing protein n=1 Tax=Nonomuraea basaltis TaxID=2495887 RepID=UPI0030B84A50
MNTDDDSSNVDTTTARAMVASNPDALVVDVRAPGELEAAHIDGAINLPLDRRATQAHRRLCEAGLPDTVVLSGGMNAWIASGAPPSSMRARPSPL